MVYLIVGLTVLFFLLGAEMMIVLAVPSILMLKQIYYPNPYPISFSYSA
jgi:hypothetical protein